MFDFFGPDFSFKLLNASQGFALSAALLGVASAVLHFTRWTGDTVREWVSRFTFAAFVAGLVASIGGLLFRWQEVNHFPVQTMFEALSTSATSLYVVFAILYFVLQLNRTKGTARGLADLFLALNMAGEFALVYACKAQEAGPRMLPPALQSYWMSTHVPALLMSYMTMSIAYVACLVFFTLKLVRQYYAKAGEAAGVAGGFQPMSRTGILVFLGFVFLVPFAQAVNIAIFIPVTIVGILLARSGRLKELDAWMEGFDKFSFAIFGVGFPFLTAGLMMGAFWAQEAWALYWGWDSKETTALISWLIYVIYLHLRFVAGWKGEKGLSVILAGAMSIFVTFQLFGYLPASQDSMHKYTDGVSREGSELSGGSKSEARAADSGGPAVAQAR